MALTRAEIMRQQVADAVADAEVEDFDPLGTPDDAPSQERPLTTDQGASDPSDREDALTDENTGADKGDDDLADDGGRISPAHKKYLVESGISRAYVDSTELIYTTRIMSDLPESLRGLAADPRGLVFAWDVLGRRIPQFRPDHPAADREGREMKYVFAKGDGAPFGVLRRARIAGGVMLIVEGTKQGHAVAAALDADAMNESSFRSRLRPQGTLDSTVRTLKVHGATVVGIAGCRSWSVNGGADPRLVQLAEGKRVVVMLDADAAENRSVYDAGILLQKALSNAESVTFATVPGGGKSGADDYLAGVAEGDRLAAVARLIDSAAKKPAPTRPSAKKAHLHAVGDAPMPELFGDGGGLLVKAIADHLLETHPMALAPDGRLAVYDNGVYRISDYHLQGLLGELLGDFFTVAHLNNVRAFLEGQCHLRGLKLRREPDSRDAPLMNVLNGMVDLRTGAVLPHDPKYLSMRQVGVAWNPDADTAPWRAWLTDRIGEGQVDAFEECLSQILDPRRSPSKALFMFGPPRSGKSTVGRIITVLAGGAESTAAVSLQDLADSDYARASLFGKVANVAMDIPAAHVTSLDAFKMATGGDLMWANKKYGKDFEFRSVALNVFSANKIPSVADDSGAYFERIIPTGFVRTYAGKEDPHVEDVLMEHLDGMLVCLVRAWQAREQRGKWLTGHTAVVERFTGQSDRVHRFVTSCCAVGVREVPATDPSMPQGVTEFPQGPLTKKELYGIFADWVTDEGGSPMGQRAFVERLLAIKGVEQIYHPITRARVLTVGMRPRDQWDEIASHSDLIPALFPNLASETAQNKTPGESMFSGSSAQNAQVGPQTSSSPCGAEAGVVGGEVGVQPTFSDQVAQTAQIGSEIPSEQGFSSAQFQSTPSDSTPPVADAPLLPRLIALVEAAAVQQLPDSASWLSRMESGEVQGWGREKGKRAWDEEAERGGLFSHPPQVTTKQIAGHLDIAPDAVVPMMRLLALKLGDQYYIRERAGQADDGGRITVPNPADYLDPAAKKAAKKSTTPETGGWIIERRPNINHQA
ncbi:DNA primase family protein [Tsukamurella pseudospumae]|uniref:Bacteriophage/plasmid primase P4 C-terminal domain-containing protein n=1 Tax=Tsukamurella pseudospumae TaxID=239498 RepID=A0A138A8J8_9ACTN|nr:phage/plasmid primase, P4 family [Tsukamurella pseudospumae]KXP06723.1 hypothetical protein AXK60_11710 [Tsukamurella pseudospumae]